MATTHEDVLGTDIQLFSHTNHSTQRLRWQIENEHLVRKTNAQP